MVRYSSVLLLTMVLAGGCDSREENGSPCNVDSDCGDGSWCDAASMTCQPVNCEDGFCDLAVGYTTSSVTSEAATTDPAVEALEREVESLKDMLSGDATSVCDPYTDDTRAIWRITSMSLGIGGVEGAGFNLDNDAETCAPTGNEEAGIPECENGIDNAIAGLAKIVNPILAENVPRKALVYSPQCDALLFPEENGDTDEFSPMSTDFTDAIAGALVTEDSLSAVTEGTWTILIPLPFGAGSILRVKATDIHVDATWNKEKEAWVGIIGGWASESALKLALSSFTTEDLEGTSPETALSIVMQLADRDTDNDGVNDEVSLGLLFEAEPIAAGEGE